MLLSLSFAYLWSNEDQKMFINIGKYFLFPDFVLELSVGYKKSASINILNETKIIPFLIWHKTIIEEIKILFLRNLR